jgi:hypothetical protein
MRWVLIVLILLVNFAAVFFALAPTFVTFAQVLPPEINCAVCDSPEVKAALASAASAGRAQVIGVVSTFSWLFIAVAVFNVAAVIAALYMPALTNPKSSDGRNSGASR